MPPSRVLASFRWSELGSILGAWIVVTLITAMTTAGSTACGPTPWFNLVLNQSLLLGTWALLTPGIFWLTQISTFSWRRFVLAHVGGVAAALAVIGLTRPIIHNLALHPLGDGHSLDRWIGASFVEHVQFDVLTYAGLFAVGMVFTHYRQRQERGRRAAALEAELTKAQLHVVQAQIDPHFLFNALNTISSVTENDPTTTRRLLAGLSSLLRRSLESASADEISLREELGYVHHYLDIMEMRHEDRLHVEIDIPPSVHGTLVPSFVLQPLLENAIRHATSRISGRGFVRVTAKRNMDVLAISIDDNGPYRDALERGTERTSIGLANVRSRLYQLYGSKASLTVSNRGENVALQDEGGTGATTILRLPCRTTSSERALHEDPTSAIR